MFRKHQKARSWIKWLTYQQKSWHLMQCTMYNVYFVENYVDFLDAADDDVGESVDDDDYFLVAASGVEKNMTAL